ncbi:MAG: ATP-binding protein [Chlorobi bacterium]|nr:ATP-binding protein [Chlorobiota bacterium]
MIQRIITNKIIKNLNKGKAILIFGPRQVGKTVLLETLKNKINQNILLLNGDDHDVQTMFEKANSSKIKTIIGNYSYIFIDEAQRIKNIGLAIKIITDNFPKVQVVATGSSAFELANEINEPLTGRKYEYFLFPLSYAEILKHTNFFEEKRQLEERIIYGCYPEIVINPTEKKELLNLLANSYLYKDLLSYEKIKKSSIIIKLLQALALQIGNEVSYNELSKLIGIDKETVEKYIDLLEKSFVIFRLNSLSRNYRNELKKSKKIYFYDTGVRNALIGNFNSLNIRADKGALWENFFISERMKYLNYSGFYGKTFFWRTKDKAEIDYVEEIDGTFYAFEIKYNPNKTSKIPESFKIAYPNHEYKIINTENYYEFLT